MKLAVFYHCKLSGEGVPNEDFCFSVMHSQMNALKKSGLSDQVGEIHIGVNGGDGDGLLAVSVAPPNSILHIHGAHARTEIPTLEVLRSWLPGHEDWYVLYHHTKGITHPNEPAYNNWRWRMERVCVWDWRDCVADLQRGYDAAGAHWLTPQRYPGAVTSPFFGGTFWWAKVAYLLELPPLPAATWENRYEAESWIGRRRPYPKVHDYIPSWP